MRHVRAAQWRSIMATENTVEVKAEVVTEGEQKEGSFVDTLFDLGTTWADAGIGYGKIALEHTAKALEKTAKSLEQLQGKLKKAS
jgi:hypothetical protein